MLWGFQLFWGVTQPSTDPYPRPWRRLASVRVRGCEHVALGAAVLLDQSELRVRTHASAANGVPKRWVYICGARGPGLRAFFVPHSWLVSSSWVAGNTNAEAAPASRAAAAAASTADSAGAGGALLLPHKQSRLQDSSPAGQGGIRRERGRGLPRDSLSETVRSLL